MEGEKIVGETPVIPPGQTFSYNSYHVTHLSAEAFGSFHGVDEFDNRIHVRMKPFSLNVPKDFLPIQLIHEDNGFESPWRNWFKLHAFLKLDPFAL